jgi:hypothetical protein
MARSNSIDAPVKVRNRAALLGSIGALAAIYWFPVRRWFARWGATQDEATRAMPGDGMIPKPMVTSTQVVTVNARPSDV